MQPVDFFRNRIDAMINLNDPLEVLATRLPLNQIEAAVATKFGHQSRVGQVLHCEDMFGTTQTVTGGGRSNAGRPKLAIRLMASLLYHKNSFISPALLRLLQAALSQMRLWPATGIETGRQVDLRHLNRIEN